MTFLFMGAIACMVALLISTALNMQTIFLLRSMKKLKRETVRTPLGELMPHGPFARTSMVDGSHHLWIDHQPRHRIDHVWPEEQSAE